MGYMHNSIHGLHVQENIWSTIQQNRWGTYTAKYMGYVNNNIYRVHAQQYTCTAVFMGYVNNNIQLTETHCVDIYLFFSILSKSFIS